MKIAIINIYQGKVERGLETFVSELSKRLRERNRVDVYEGKSPSLKRWPVLWRMYLDPHGIKIALFTLKLLPKILKEKYDVVLPQNGGWQPALIRLVTWLYKGKMVISGQSGKGWDDRNNLWCFPDRFVALSAENKSWADKANPLVRSEYIPNGVDLTKFTAHGPKYKTMLKKPIVVCQGALEPSKRLHLAIEAVKKLGGTSLLIIGQGSLEKELLSLGKNKLGSRFGIVHVAHSEMPSLYRLGNVFTLPSVDTEAFGISYVEAMACNLPVVATDNKTRREIVGDAGLFVDPENTFEYAKALRKALESDFGNKPRTQALKFSWDGIAKEYEELMQKLYK